MSEINIESIASEVTELRTKYESLKAENQRLRKLIARLPQWIGVDERLPEPGVNVLAIVDRGDTPSQHYTVYRTEPMVDDKFWTWRDSHTGRQEIWFTHWQPLPVAPSRDRIKEGK